MRFVLYAILAYVLFQFIFKLVIPVYLASRKIKKGFRDMQNRMQEQQQPFDSAQGKQGYQAETTSSKPETRTKTGDYIDFEEVK